MKIQARGVEGANFDPGAVCKIHWSVLNYVDYYFPDGAAMRQGARFLLLVGLLGGLLPRPAAAEPPAAPVATADPADNTGDLISQLRAENNRLRLTLERRESDLQTAEFQLQSALAELERARATIATMRQELQERLAALAGARPDTPARGSVTPRPAATGTNARPAAGTRTYTVQPGDTLGKIAAHFYHDAAAWPRILAANQPKLPAPERLRAGMVLVIPD